MARRFSRDPTERIFGRMRSSFGASILSRAQCRQSKKSPGPLPGHLVCAIITHPGENERNRRASGVGDHYDWRDGSRVFMSIGAHNFGAATICPVSDAGRIVRTTLETG